MPDLTITLTTQQAQRVQAAYQAGMPEGQTAGIADVKADLIELLVNKVHSHETQLASVAAANAVVRMDKPA